MARDFYGIEKGIDIYAENGDLLARVFSGTGIPTGADDQATAPIGSLYIRSGTREHYIKVLNNGNGADWILSGVQLSFRPEKVRAVTSENVLAGVRDLVTNPFTDDQVPTMVAADFEVGEFLISNSASTAVLLEVTNVSGDSVTFSAPITASPLAEFDNFVAVNYLPDAPADQELQALIQISSAGSVIKVSDVNWNFANGITLNGYTESQGPILGTDTLQVSTEKTGGDVTDLVTLSGVSRGSVVLGSFSSPASLLLSASLSIKSAFQRVGELFAQLRGVEVTGITTITTVDEVLVDDVQTCKWFVEVFEQATPTKKKAVEVLALNNGTASSDATNVADNRSAVLNMGPNFNYTISVDLNGAGASQTMRLRATSSTAGITVRARRIEIRKSTI